MGTINYLTERAVKEIRAICPGVNLYYLDYLAGTWRQKERGKKKANVTTKEKVEHAKKTVECAEGLWNLLNDKRFNLPPIYIRNAINPIDLKLVFWILEKIANEAKNSHQLYLKSDGRKRPSKMSGMICDIAQLIERAGGVVDSRPNGQLVQIIGIVAEVAGQTPPDRSSVRDVLKRGYDIHDREYWDEILEEAIFKGDEETTPPQSTPT